MDAKVAVHDSTRQAGGEPRRSTASVNQAESLGTSRSPAPAAIVPRSFEFRASVRSARHDPGKAKQLLAEAGYANGFDAGTFTRPTAVNAMARPEPISAVGNPHTLRTQ